jgi:hypothetical protein
MISIPGARVCAIEVLDVFRCVYLKQDLIQNVANHKAIDKGERSLKRLKHEARNR